MHVYNKWWHAPGDWFAHGFAHESAEKDLVGKGGEGMNRTVLAITRRKEGILI